MKRIKLTLTRTTKCPPSDLKNKDLLKLRRELIRHGKSKTAQTITSVYEQNESLYSLSFLVWSLDKYSVSRGWEKILLYVPVLIFVLPELKHTVVIPIPNSQFSFTFRVQNYDSKCSPHRTWSSVSGYWYRCEHVANSLVIRVISVTPKSHIG